MAADYRHPDVYVGVSKNLRTESWKFNTFRYIVKMKGSTFNENKTKYIFAKQSFEICSEPKVSPINQK